MENRFNNMVEIERMLQFLDIQEVTTKRQKKNGTREFKLPIKDLYCSKGSYIHVASFASGYVRRTKASGYCPAWQLNKRIDRRRNDILVVRAQTGMDDSSDVDRLALTRSEREEATRENQFNRVLLRRGTLPAEELEDIFSQLVEGPRRVRSVPTGNELLDFMEEAYPIAEETFSVPI